MFVAWWYSGYGAAVAIRRSCVQLQAVPSSCNNSGKLFTHTDALSQSSIIWYRSVGSDDLQLGR